MPEKHPNELELPPVGLALLEDAETGEVVEVDLANARVHEAIASRVADARRERERIFARARIDYLPLVAGEPYDAALHRLFATRARR